MSSRVVLSAAGVSLAIIITKERLPEVIYWGADLGDTTIETFDTLARTAIFPVGPNQPDAPPRHTVLLEGQHGWLGKPGLIGSRLGKDWTPQWRVTNTLLDGADPGEFAVAGSATLIVTARADLAALELQLTITLNEHGLIETQAMLTNLGEEQYLVDEFTIGLPVPNQAAELIDFAGRWGVERSLQRHSFTVGQHRREGRQGRTGADAAYVLHAAVPGAGFQDGEIWSVHTGWSGNHIHLAERDAVGFQALSGGELLLPGEVCLGRGESYTTPWNYFNYAVGLDAQAARFHNYLRAMPHAPNTARPVTLNVWEAVYFDHDADRLIDLAERAAALGVERFVLDDGWFGGRRDDHAGLGDWVVSPDVWPDGLHPLVNKVKDLGMEFGLWFEPEMVNLDSDVARAHPEWIMQPAGRLPIEARFQQVLNLGIPEAWDHVFQQIDAVLSEYQIDYVKWDCNRPLIDAGTAPEGRPGVHKQTVGFYRLLDALRQRHPNVEFESCASGGARIDLEVLKRAERVWVSDVIDPEERQRMLLWTSQLIPAEWQGSHIASGRSHTTARWHDLNFRAATAVFGHLGIEWDLSQATPEELADLTWWIEWYKANREVLLSGQQVRIQLRDDEVYFKGVVTDDKAIYSLSMLRVSPSVSLGNLRFLGLDPDARYQVKVIDKQLVYEVHIVPWMQDGEPVLLTGRQLMTAGIKAPYMQPATAVLFELEKV